MKKYAKLNSLEVVIQSEVDEDNMDYKFGGGTTDSEDN